MQGSNDVPAIHALRRPRPAGAGVALAFSLACGVPALSATPSGELPTASVDPARTCFTSIQDAAVSGLLTATLRDRTIEYGGAILERSPGCFVYTDPVSTGRTDRVDFIVARREPAGTLVGIYHTHTDGENADIFSPGDEKVQRQLAVPSFLGTVSIQRRWITVRLLSSPAAMSLRSALGTEGQVIARLAVPRPTAKAKALERDRDH